MTSETEKKLAAMSDEDKRAAERWAATVTSDKSFAAFIDGVESRLGRPFDAIDSIIWVGKLMLREGIGYDTSEFTSDSTDTR